MTKAQLELLIDLALIVNRYATPEDQGCIGRRLEEMHTEEILVRSNRDHYRKHPLPVVYEK